MRIERVSGLVAAATLAVVASLSSCGGGMGSLDCASIQSVSGFVQGFSMGLDNFSDDQYEQLRLNSLDARDTVEAATRYSDNKGNAQLVLSKISLFIASMDEVSWDVSRAIDNTEAVAAALALGSETTLREANEVEGYVINECGLPSTIPIGTEGDVTLPDPSIPSPTATDPPTNTINEESEAVALGTTVASIFSLTLDPRQVECLGRSLSGVVDLSDASSNSAQYQGQFQGAFDSCGINFSVPID